MKTELTIIIPFLNEGTEIENTVNSILETAVTNPYIILINDNSTDGFDYEEIAKKHSGQITYVRHEERKGVAASRDEGVDLSQTPYFLLLDGHMRFYEKGWDKRLVKLLKKHTRTVLCSQTRVLNKDESGEIITKDHIRNYGAYIKIDNLRADWNKKEISDSNIVEISCILGAAYACEKSYWQYLHGLKGLIHYGIDEQLISTKVWLEGGKCLLVKDWVVGHIYRKETPYGNPINDFTYNRLYFAQLLLPFSVKQKAFEKIRSESRERFQNAYKILRENYKEIKKEKVYLAGILQFPIEEFIEKNNKTAKQNKNNSRRKENEIHIIME